jgi:hypothetical protein
MQQKPKSESTIQLIVTRIELHLGVDAKPAISLHLERLFVLFKFLSVTSEISPGILPERYDDSQNRDPPILEFVLLASAQVLGQHTTIVGGTSKEAGFD